MASVENAIILTAKALHHGYLKHCLIAHSLHQDALSPLEFTHLPNKKYQTCRQQSYASALFVVRAKCTRHFWAMDNHLQGAQIAALLMVQKKPVRHHVEHPLEPRKLSLSLHWNRQD